MVEQDVKQASPAFSDLQSTNDKYHSFETDSIKCMNNDPISSLVLNDDNIDLSNELPDEELLFSDGSTNEHSLNKKKLDGLWQPLADMYSSPSDPYFEASSPLSIWSPYPLDLEAMKIDEVFQVDKDDIFHSPTLAELNANDESLFDSFDCFDGFFPSGNKITLNKSDNSDFKICPFNLPEQPKQILLVHSLEKEFSHPVDPSSLKQDINLISTEPDCIPKPILNDAQFENIPASTNEKKKPSKSCIALSNKRIKTQHEDETTSKVELLDEKVSENSHLSCSSNIDEYDSEEDSEFEGDYSTDADEESDDEIKSLSSKYSSVNRINLEKKKSRYFWQYNMQSKGPKGPKMKLTNKLNSVHDLPGVSDPVFSATCPIEGVKHSGKARRGDGNDLTPNPKKLYNIGIELEKLSSLIDGLVPVNELPVNARTKSRKEKNKLASRACRLKKKAQHEANKLKLFGLQQEQKGLLKYINEVKKVVKNRVQNIKLQKDSSTIATIEAMQINKGVIKVAGCSADFVNNVIKAVASGDDCGGLHIPLKQEN